MFTRKQYLDKECTHSEYYSQFITPAQKTRVRSFIRYYKGVELDVIPITVWDMIGVDSEVFNLFRKAGDYVTLAGAVCLNKECAKIILESE